MIVNLTQHAATPEQVADGVVDTGRSSLRGLLTFDSLPSRVVIEQRARCIARIAAEMCADRAMIGGAPYLMAPLEIELRKLGITPVYAFSVRESVESFDPDGTVKKTAVFRHAGWVGA